MYNMGNSKNPIVLKHTHTQNQMNAKFRTWLKLEGIGGFKWEGILSQYLYTHNNKKTNELCRKNIYIYIF